MTDGAGAPRRVLVLGLLGAPTPALAAQVARADVVIGSARHVSLVNDALRPGRLDDRRIVVVGTGGRRLDDALEQVSDAPGNVAVLASGDPGFFGVLGMLRRYFPADRLDVHPAPSSVAVAFARLGRSWQDATVVSAHGRPVHAAALAGARSPLAAILCGPDAPPEVLAAELVGLGQGDRRAVVAERLGEPTETLSEATLGDLSAGHFDPLAVLVVLDDPPAPERSAVVDQRAAPLAWGLPDSVFSAEGGLLTKAEVRAVVLARLALPSEGVLWDVGAGSGSVAVECARLRPALHVIALERRRKRLELIERNARCLGTVVDAVLGEAPAALQDLPSPDRVFVGGGGLGVLDACLERLRAGGIVVATFASIARAAEAESRLGNLVQLGVARSRRLPDGSVRLAAENPVFVAWGPSN